MLAAWRSAVRGPRPRPKARASPSVAPTIAQLLGSEPDFWQFSKEPRSDGGEEPGFGWVQPRGIKLFGEPSELSLFCFFDRPVGGKS